MKIADIYDHITRYLFWEISIHMPWINRQHFRLARSLFHNILIETYKQEILRYLW